MSRYFRSAHALRPRGFALAAVLWLLAGLTILAAMISQSSQILAQRQQQLRQRADAEQHFLSTRSEVLFWLSSSQATQDGFGWGDQLLKVDGRGYAGAGKSTIQVQDVRGLLNLNRPNRPQLARLLVRCGAEQAKTDGLLDALEDYAEKGELKRLNGAKSMEYSVAGLPAPRYAPLLGEPEIWRVYGWKALQPGWDAKHCFDDVTVHGDGRFNLGTATAGALEGYGLTPELAAHLIGERGAGENAAADAIQTRQSEGSFMGTAEGRFPARAFRVTQSVAGMPWVFRYDVKLTSTVVGAPWEIAAPHRLPATSVMIAAGRARLPVVDQISETDKNVITQPVLPF